jgi:hypothetical protein
MYQEINTMAASGKTLKAFCCSGTSGQMIMIFNDETFVTFGVNRPYYSDDYEIIPKKLEWLEFGDEQLIRHGLATQAEIDSRRADFIASHR